MSKLTAAVDHSNPNHMFIDRHELRLIRTLLAEIPELATELGVAVIKQARLGEVGRSRKPRRPSEQAMPYHLAAADIARQLHNCLGGWVRLVCEQRSVEVPFDYLPQRSAQPLPDPKGSWPDRVPTTAELARWLDRNAVALAMTEGCETALDEIRDIVRAAESLVCPPSRPVVIDEGQRTEARKALLNASGIATLAKELGEQYRHLTRRRVHVLHEKELIAPIPGPWLFLMFRVGDVMDAHLLLPIRERHAKAS